MNCDLASEYLDAFIDGELEPSVEIELREHLRNCLLCQSQISEIRELRSVFRMFAPRYQAPVELRARVMNITSRAQKKSVFRLSRYTWIAAAAILFLGLLVQFLASVPDRGKEISNQAVVDYTRILPESPTELASADFAVLKPWFSDKVGFSPPRIDLHDYGYELTGGRVGLLGKRRVVALVYKRGDETLTIYCWPPNQEPVSSSKRSIDGYRVYLWSNSACNYVLVQKADDPKIEQFVDSFEDQPSGAFY